MPLQDVLSIAGNAPLSAKLAIVHEFAATLDKTTERFSHDVAESLKFLEMSVEKRADTDNVESRVACECVVTKAMVNGAGNIHGACSAYLIDMCTSFALSLSSLQAGGNGRTGITQSLNVVYHAPAPTGTPIRIIGRSLTSTGGTMAGKCEIWDTKNKRLVSSGIMSKTIPVQVEPPRQIAKL